MSLVQLCALCVAAGDSGQPGTVTAGNASVIADGAAALVLVSAERASELGLRVSSSCTSNCRSAAARWVQDPVLCCKDSCCGLSTDLL